jgi:type IV secretory pathway TrbL component
MDELDLKHLLPQLALGFLLINSSIFLIDIIISISNGMIDALRAGFGDVTVWQVLNKVTDQSGSAGIATLLIMVVFLVLAFVLLVYYVGRLVTLYLGAALSPVLLLLWLLPSFKDFAASAVKSYMTTVFVLFVHVVILMLASSIFATLISGQDQTPDPIMSLIVGLSTLVALLKTQGVLTQLNYVSLGPKAIRRLSSQFMNGLNQTTLKPVRQG